MEKNTYLINSESGREKGRLIRQDVVINDLMQTLLPKHLDPFTIHSTLDLACGSGGWALELATHYPHMHVVGVDISRTMIEYAQVCAKDRHLTNCTFEQRTVFPSEHLPSISTLETSFDFINLRLGMAFMPYASWLPLFEWCYKRLRKGGHFRVTEQGQYAHSHGETLALWFSMMSKALVQRKMLESEFGSVTLILDTWMEQAGFRDIQEYCYLLNFSAGRKHHRAMADDWASAIDLLLPFLIHQQMGTREELEELRQRVIREMHAPEFLAHLYYPSFVGKKIGDA